MEEIRRLSELRKIAGLSQYQLAKRAGLSVRTIKGYEYSAKTPSVKSYNALAEILGFEKLPEPKKIKPKKSTPQAKSSKTQKRYDKVQDTRDDSELLAIALPEKTIFETGHLYAIYESPKDRDFVFRYTGKTGIHHCFVEIHGGWSMTLADYQLIGKTVKEVE